jgi:hypothetical protein
MRVNSISTDKSKVKNCQWILAKSLFGTMAEIHKITLGPTVNGLGNAVCVLVKRDVVLGSLVFWNFSGRDESRQ